MQELASEAEHDFKGDVNISNEIKRHIGAVIGSKNNGNGEEFETYMGGPILKGS